MNRTAKLLATLAALTTLALAACGAPSGPSALEGKTWTLQSYGRPADMQDVLQGTEITALFDGAEGQVNGSAGCNSYFGGYQADGSKLSISPLAVTEMYCLTPEGVMEQEQQFLAALGTAESYAVQEGQLRVSCSDGRLLVFGAK